VGPIFLGLLWDIKIFFEIQRFWQQNCREWRRKNYFLFFGHWILWFFLSFMIWRKKRKILFLIWLIKCPYFFVVIADDKFEMIVGRTFDIFLVHFFTSFLYESFPNSLLICVVVWKNLLILIVVFHPLCFNRFFVMFFALIIKNLFFPCSFGCCRCNFRRCCCGSFRIRFFRFDICFFYRFFLSSFNYGRGCG